MNLKKAQLEVNKIKRMLPDNGYEYKDVVCGKVNYKPAIFTVLASVLMIVGVFSVIYFTF